MKHNSMNKPLVCMQAHSDYYARTILNRADPIIIQDFNLKSITANSAKISFVVDDKFDKYIWKYSLTNLKTAKTGSDTGISVESKTPEVLLSGLTPNSPYSLKLIAVDKNNTVNTIKAPDFRFYTKQDYPEPVSEVFFDAEKLQVSFKSPNSWGSTSDRNKGYTVKILVNGYEKASSNSLIPYKKTSGIIKADVSSLFKTVTLNHGDTIQIELTAWTIDEQGTKVCAQTGGESTAPIYIRAKQPFINKIFLSLDKNYQRAALYLNLDK